jgi:hypothetical protein
MFGLHMEVQRLLLEKFLVAVRTFMWVCAGMFLHVVMHRILPFLDDATVDTFVMSVGIFLIGEFVHFIHDSVGQTQALQFFCRLADLNIHYSGLCKE